MTIPQRATQIWPILTLSATNNQILTYDFLAKLISVPPPALGQLLEPIQSYCLIKKLPPLTILVVSKKTGLPGSGFSAVSEIPKYQIKVFEYDWLKHGCPAPDEFTHAVETLQSNIGKLKTNKSS
jgi:hypothetical protein